MGQAFSIQSFFIPVLKKNPNPSRYTFYTMIAYILGACAYYYIAYMGSFGILHRYPSENPQTIENYFAAGVWEVKII
jgi:membrane protein YqaA with SNARE-associated domain